MNKNHLGIFVLVFLLVGMVASASQIQKVEAPIPNSIFIRSDGTVDPPTAPITTVDNITYTLTDNIVTTFSAIVIQRNNTIIDGAGYSVQTVAGIYNGIWVANQDNVTIKNFNITNCYSGIFLDTCTRVTINNTTCTSHNNGILTGGHSGVSNVTIIDSSITGNTNGLMFSTMISDSVISGNIIQQNGNGVNLIQATNVTVQNNLISGNTHGVSSLSEASNVSIVDNTISDNDRGIYLQGGNDTTRMIYHNRFINNGVHVRVEYPNILCTWDNGYPSGGNYWSGYISPDLYSGPYQNVTGGDGIGDAPYIVDRRYGNNSQRDRYPFMFVSICNVSQTPPKSNVLSTDTVSVNATVTHLNPLEQVVLNCTYTNSSATWTSMINMTNLEDDIWHGIIPPFPAGTNVTYAIIAYDDIGNSVSSEDQGYTFEYPVVIPEFPSLLLLPLLMITTLLAVILYGRKRVR